MEKRTVGGSSGSAGSCGSSNSNIDNNSSSSSNNNNSCCSSNSTTTTNNNKSSGSGGPKALLSIGPSCSNRQANIGCGSLVTRQNHQPLASVEKLIGGRTPTAELHHCNHHSNQRLQQQPQQQQQLQRTSSLQQQQAVGLTVSTSALFPLGSVATVTTAPTTTSTTTTPAPAVTAITLPAVTTVPATTATTTITAATVAATTTAAAATATTTTTTTSTAATTNRIITTASTTFFLSGRSSSSSSGSNSSGGGGTCRSNSSVGPTSSGGGVTTAMHSNGDHRSPIERVNTSGNLQIPYDDFVFEVGSLVGVMLPPESVASGRSNAIISGGSGAGVAGSGGGGGRSGSGVEGMAYGVVRWAGYINDEPMLGLEMDDYGFQSGYLHDAWYFDCEPGKGLFARPEQCVPDERIQQMTLMDQSPHHDAHDNQLLNMVYDPLPGDFPPLFSIGTKDLSLLVGRCKGIQGHHNSCYLDATLFAMFTATSVFDFILDRPREESDIPEYDQVQKVLKEDIVNCLRAHRFVGAAQVMRLRELLDKLGSVSGLTCEEKDPEEFLNCLTQMLQVEPFVELSSGQSAHLYQLFVEKDDGLGIPWFQQILEQSFFHQDLKLRQLPSVFIVQMPRFGRQFKVYPRVLPSLHLDMTDLLASSPRPCHVCAGLAQVECSDCYTHVKAIERSTFCDVCYNRTHLRMPSHRSSAKRRLSVSAGFQDFSSTKHLPRHSMELFALLCIETSHYVAFVKCGQQPTSPWVFFDSMADRHGQSNIPEVVSFDEIYDWLSRERLESHPDDRSLPPLVKKIVADAYMCFYRSATVSMYN